MPRAKCGKTTERTVDFYLTEYKPERHGATEMVRVTGINRKTIHKNLRVDGFLPEEPASVA